MPWSDCVVGNLEVASGSTGAGTLVSLVRPPLWSVMNLGPLWLMGDVRGTDVLMPGAVGVRPFRRRTTVTGYSLPFMMSGVADPDDPPEDCDDPDGDWVRLESRLATLNADIVAQPNTRQGTREAVLTMPSGALRYADIHVLRITPTQIEDAVLAGTLDISIPAGQFTA